MISARLIGGTAPNAKSWPWAVPARPRLDGAIGDLVQTTAGKWITHRPTRCPNGHPLGPNQVLVGHQAAGPTAAGTEPGHAGYAMRLSTVRLWTLTTRRSRDQRTVRISSHPGSTTYCPILPVINPHAGGPNPPTRCPNGDTLGPGEILVCHRACPGHGGGHTTWTCRN